MNIVTDGIPGQAIQRPTAPNNLQAFFNFDFAQEDENTPVPTTLAPAVATRKKRVCICPTCGVAGHLKKKCPQRVMPSPAPMAPNPNLAGPRPIEPATPAPGLIDEGGPVDDADGGNDDGSDGGSDEEREFMDPAIVEDNEAAQRLRREQETPVETKKQRWTTAFKVRNCGKHVPCVCSDAERRWCIICSVKTNNKCQHCDVHVHWKCWSSFHDFEDPWTPLA